MSAKLSRILLALAILLFSAYFTYDAFLRHDNLHSLRLDLGNMDQTVWNVLHGHGFTLTNPMGTTQVSRLSIHADFLLILLAPFYLIWSSPKMLLIIQAVVLGLGAVPIFWLALKVLKNRWIALLFAVAFLLYPTVQLNTLHDFHATSLTTTFLLFAFWYFVDERPVLFTVFAVLSALGKEQFWAVTALLSAAWIFKPKYRTFGAISAGIHLLVFYVLLWKIIPSVTPAKQHWALMYFTDYGGSMNDVLKNILIHPQQTITSLIAPDRLYYYFQLLSPLGFLSLVNPVTLIFALPNLAINTLSNDMLMRMIDYQYTSGITPWVFVSAIYGFAVVKKYVRPWIPAVILGICTLSSVYFWGELPVGPHSRFAYFHTEPPEAVAIRKVVYSIPQKYSVSVTNNIGAQLSQRELLYNYPEQASSAAYVVVELGDQYAWPSGDEQVRVLKALMTDNNYELIEHTGSFSALKRRDL